MKVDALKTLVATVGVADANIGTPIPSLMKRVIYKMKWENEFAGVNLLTLGKRENGAGATTVIDYGRAIAQYDAFIDPDSLHEDSAPLYTIDGPPDTADPTYVGTSYIRAQATGASIFLTLWYEDVSAP